jgi:hypothetical protein
VKQVIAARVAAKLRKDPDVEVETVSGELLEFSVYIDGQKAIDTNRLLYPAPAKIVKKVQAALAE